MKLSTSDRKMLKSWGHTAKDLNQIEVATSLTAYEYKGKLVCDVKARELLGDEGYLSGISRSAFHYSASRQTPDGEEVSFDSSALFKL